MKNLYEKFKTSLTDFLLILILIFLGVGINLLSDINKNLNYIYSITRSIDNESCAAMFELGRNNSKNNWSEDEYKNVYKYYKDFFKIYNSYERNNN